MINIFFDLRDEKIAQQMAWEIEWNLIWIIKRVG